MGLPVYEMRVEDLDAGVDKVSLVDDPAIGRLWVALRQEQAAAPLRLKLSVDRQMLYGPLMVPDLLIFRRDPDGTEYNVVFREQEIQRMAERFAASGLMKEINLMHNTDTVGNVVMESWIIEDPEKDKAASLGMADLPRGTWMIGVKVGDTKFWNEQIKTGRLKGFSLEGLFGHQRINAAKLNQLNKMQTQESISQQVQTLLTQGGGAKRVKLTNQKLALREKQGQQFRLVQFNADAPPAVLDPITQQAVEVLPDGEYQTPEGVDVQVTQGVAETQQPQPQPQQIQQQPQPQPVAVPVAMATEYPLQDGGVLVWDNEAKSGSLNGETVKPGSYQLAEGGVLVIDENGNMTTQAAMQAQPQGESQFQRQVRQTLQRQGGAVGKVDLRQQAQQAQIEDLKQSVLLLSQKLADVQQQQQQQQQQPQAQAFDARNKNTSVQPQPQAQRLQFEGVGNDRGMARHASMIAQLKKERSKN